MPTELTRCLLDAVAALRKADFLEPESRAAIIEDLEQTIARDGTPEVRMARALAAARRAKTAAAAAATTKMVTDARVAQKLADLDKVPAELAGDFVLNRVLQRPTGPSLQQGVSEVIVALADADMGELQPVMAEIVDHRYGQTFGWAKTSPVGLQVEAGVHGVLPKDAVAAELTKKLRAKINAMTDELRDLGVYIDRKGDWWRQTHDIASIAADQRAWKKFLVAALDPAEFPDPAQAVDALWRTLQTRHLDDPVANALSLGRVFNLRTPALELEYARRFGVGTFPEQIETTVRNLRRRIELAREFGPSVERGWQEVQEVARKRVQSLVGTAPAETVARQETALFKSEEGSKFLFHPVLSPANQTLSTWAAALRTTARAMFLGGVTLWHVTTDPVLAMAAIGLQRNGVRALDVYSKLLLGMPKGKALEYVQDYGLMLMHIGATRGASSAQRFEIGSTVAPDGSAPVGARLLRGAERVDDWVQRASLAHATRERTKAAIALRSSRNLALYAEKDWVKLDPAYRSIAENNGWTETLWKKLQDNRGTFDADLGTVNVRVLPPELRRVVITHLHREAFIGNANPTLFNRLTLSSYSRETGFGDVLTKNAAQFLASPVAIVQNIIARQLKYGGWLGNSVFFGALLMGGLLYVQLRALVVDGKTFAWDSPDLLGRAVIASGVLTPWGDALAGALRGDPGRPAPLLGLALAPLKGGHKMLDSLIDGDYTQAGFEAVRTANSLLPNVWWYRAGVNRAVDVLAESWSPDYARYRQRQERQRQQGFFD